MNNLVGLGFILFGTILILSGNRNRINTEGPFKYHLFVKSIIGGIISILIGVCCLIGIISTDKIF